MKDGNWVDRGKTRDMRCIKLTALAAVVIAGSFVALGARPNGIADFYRDNLSPAAFAVWLSGLVVATLAPPALAITFWFGSMRVRQGWLFHILLVPTTYAVMRGAIATMLWAAHEPDSDGLTGWATDPAMLLLLICPVVYFSTLGLMRLHRRSLTANGS